MIRLTVILLAGMVGVLIAYDQPSEPAASNDDTTTSPTDIIDRPDLEIVVVDETPVTAGITEITPVTVSVAATPVHQVSRDATSPALLQVVSRDAPADAQIRPTNTSQTEADASIWFITGSRVNLRQGPSTQYRIVTSLKRDTAARIIGYDGDWAHLRVVDTGAEGYMARRFLRQ